MKYLNSSAIVSMLGVIALCALGCDKAPDAVTKAEESAKKAVVAVEHGAEEAIAKAKEEFAKMTDGHLDGFEQKIKDLSGEAMTEAKTLLETIKEKAMAIKDAAPEKFAELKKEIGEKIAELKSKIGQ